MNKYQYSITMSAPLGKRNGSMSFSLKDGHIDGLLNILGHSEPFEGKLMTDGICEISGKIISLTRTIFYHATGTILNGEIYLQFQDQKNKFYIIGKETLV